MTHIRMAFVVFRLLLVFLLGEIHDCAYSDCTDHWDCGEGKYCCADWEYGYPDESWMECGNETCSYCQRNSTCGYNGECCRETHCSKHCCKHDHECDEGKFCCKEANVDGSPAKLFRDGDVGISYKRLYCNNTCVGTICRQHTDCAWPRECCVNSVCTSDSCRVECSHHYDCKNNQYCCPGQKNQSSYCDDTCPYNPGYKDDCSLWGDCGNPGNCCTKESYGNGTCTRNCIDNICRKDEDCAWPDECCSSTWRCTTKCKDKCKSRTDCKESECCKIRPNRPNFCVHDCVGESCYNHVHCALPGECCSLQGLCTRSNYSCRRECEYDWKCRIHDFPEEPKKHGAHKRKLHYSGQNGQCCSFSEVPYKYCTNHCPYENLTKPTPRPRPPKPSKNDEARSSAWVSTFVPLFTFLLLGVAFIVWKYLKRKGRNIKSKQFNMYKYEVLKVDDWLNTHDNNYIPLET